MQQGLQKIVRRAASSSCRIPRPRR
jgi:hypothetical protein